MLVDSVPLTVHISIFPKIQLVNLLPKISSWGIWGLRQLPTLAKSNLTTLRTVIRRGGSLVLFNVMSCLFGIADIDVRWTILYNVITL